MKKRILIAVLTLGVLAAISPLQETKAADEIFPPLPSGVTIQE
jgi:hypothetical protein